MIETNSLISVKNLSKVYKMGDFEVHALRDVTLEIQKGSFVAVKIGRAHV